MNFAGYEKLPKSENKVTSVYNPRAFIAEVAESHGRIRQREIRRMQNALHNRKRALKDVNRVAQRTFIKRVGICVCQKRAYRTRSKNRTTQLTQ